MTRPDLSDAKLVALLAAAACAIGLWFALRAWLPQPWRTPGSPQLYLAGVAGALLLLVPAAFSLAKRAGRSRNPVGWFNAHVVCSTLGMVLIAAHSGAFLRRPPALLLLALVALAVLGTWARIAGARRMAATFASRLPGFGVPDAATRERLKAILAEKRRLLAELAPGAREGTFSVTLPLLAVRPRLAGARLALAVLLAGLLALIGRHLAPALRVPLNALALLGRHGLELAGALENLLLLLRRQPLEALVRGVELAFPLLGQRLPPPEVLRDASPIGRRHVAQPLLILARGLPLLGRETLPVAVVLDRSLPLLGRHLLPLL